MKGIKANKGDSEKVSQKEDLLSLENLPARPYLKKLTNSKWPYLRPHDVKGRLYYSYCRGSEKEIYLGSADAILKAVKGK